MTSPAIDHERAATILAIAAATLLLLAVAWFVRAVREAREARRRLGVRQAMAITSNRSLSCQLCHQPHDTLLAVPLADVEEVSWLCMGCHAVLVPAGVES